MACLGMVPTLLTYGKDYNHLTNKGVCFLLSDHCSYLWGCFLLPPKAHHPHDPNKGMNHLLKGMLLENVFEILVTHVCCFSSDFTSVSWVHYPLPWSGCAFPQREMPSFKHHSSWTSICPQSSNSYGTSPEGSLGALPCLSCYHSLLCEDLNTDIYGSSSTTWEGSHTQEKMGT